jgi:hypothetical protein
LGGNFRLPGSFIQDITGDGKIGIEEAMHILKKVSGLL